MPTSTVVARTLSTTAPTVRVVAKVSRRQARKFVDSFFETWRECAVPAEALSDAGLYTWPDGSDDVNVTTTPAQDECIALEDAILDAVEARLRKPLEDVFLEVARDVLASYRRGDLVLSIPEPPPAAALMLPDMGEGLEGGRAILGNAIATALASGLIQVSVTTAVADCDGTTTSVFWTNAKRVPVVGDEVFLGLPAARSVVGVVKAVNDDGSLEMGSLSEGGVIDARRIATGAVKYYGIVEGSVHRTQATPERWHELLEKVRRH